jgi:hypothetical protein
VYILRIEFNDLGGRPLRLSLHADEEQARQGLREYVRENWAAAFEGSSDWKFNEFDDPDTAVDLYFNQTEDETFAIDLAYVAGADPFDTITAFHGLVKAFVEERIESIMAEASQDDGGVAVAVGDFDTLEWLEDDVRDRIGHIRFFLDQADRLVARHGGQGR